MDQTEGLRRCAAADDAFQQSLARLSLQIATRHSILTLPAPLPALKRAATGWLYFSVTAIAVAGAAAAGYQYAGVFKNDLMRATASTVVQGSAAGPNLAPVVDAIAVQPKSAPAGGPPAPVNDEPEPIIDAALTTPMPTPPSPIEPTVQPAATDNEVALSRVEILEVQKRLVSLGIDAGPLDGFVGRRTIRAVQRYEELRGRDITGKVDRGMLKQLQQDLGPSPTLEARAP
jgi:hypothetical protein